MIATDVASRGLGTSFFFFPSPSVRRLPSLPTSSTPAQHPTLPHPSLLTLTCTGIESDDGPACVAFLSRASRYGVLSLFFPRAGFAFRRSTTPTSPLPPASDAPRPARSSWLPLRVQSESALVVNPLHPHSALDWPHRARRRRLDFPAAHLPLDSVRSSDAFWLGLRVLPFFDPRGCWVGDGGTGVVLLGGTYALYSSSLRSSLRIPRTVTIEALDLARSTEKTRQGSTRLGSPIGRPLFPPTS